MQVNTEHEKGPDVDDDNRFRRGQKYFYRWVEDANLYIVDQTVDVLSSYSHHHPQN